MDKIKKQIEEKITEITAQGVRMDNLEALGELVDIHKDIANEEYWDKKKEVMDMNYRGEYNNYGNDGYGARRRDSRGRYMERGRGRGNYRGNEPMEEMYEKYQEYSEGKEQYNRGNYGAEGKTMKALEYMLESAVDFFEMLKEDASSQEEIQMIKHYAKKISEML